MLGNVTRNEVDMAVVDLTITAERQSVVDFTLPFMNTGKFYRNELFFGKQNQSVVDFFISFSQALVSCTSK